MRQLIAAAAVIAALFAWHTEVQASCTAWTYTTPDGRIVTCMTCYFPGGAHTTCQ